MFNKFDNINSINSKILLKHNLYKYILIFESLYSTNSVSKTAKELNLNISTISICLKKKKKIINKKLFIRCGRNNLTHTDFCEDFFKTSLLFLETLSQLNLDTMQNEDKNRNIRIFCHPLMSDYYLMEIFKDKKNIDYVASIDVGDREDSFQKLKNNETDLIIFPMEWSDLKQNKDIYKIETIRPYNLKIIMNKKNKFANMYEEYITWEDIKQMKLMPRNKNSQLNTGFLMLNNNYKKQLFTHSGELYLLYLGIKNNLWSVCAGEEFEKIFDCSEFKIKDHKSMEQVMFSVNWVAMYSKTLNETMNKKIQKLLEMIRSINLN